MKKSTKITIISVAIICIACLIFVGCNYQEVGQDNLSYSTLGVSSTTNPYDTYYDIVVEEDIKTEEEQEKFELVAYDTKDNKELKGVFWNMYVKIVGEQQIEVLGNHIIVDGVVYTNPENNPNIDISKLGYKELFVDSIPEYDCETQYVYFYYYDDGEYIHRAIRIENMTKEEIEQQKKLNEEYEKMRKGE